MDDVTPTAQATDPENKPALVEAKQLLEIEKLRLEMKFIPRNHYAQFLNPVTVFVVGLLVFYFVQRPQIDQMEITRLATEKQQVSTLAMSALALDNPQDRATMLNAVNAMYPQYEFLGSLARSQTLLTQVAAASAPREVQQSPPSRPVQAPPSSTEPDPLSVMRNKRQELDELERRASQIDELCQRAREETNKLEMTRQELLAVMDKE